MKQIILQPIQEDVVHISKIKTEPVIGVVWHINSAKGFLFEAVDGFQCIQAQATLSHEDKSKADTVEKYMQIYPQDKFYEFERVSDLLKWLVD